MKQLILQSFPKAIIHIDGDAFFASCEVARDPSLRGKPVITGKERGIASSMSYEAKARGVTRGMQLHVIKQICPDAIILPSDYESYSLYSKRMFEIVRRYTPDVDEYSIDECFADLTGMRRVLGMSYEQMAENIKKDLDSELGMTFSVGLSVNKVMAKVGSKWKKPSGLTIIPGYKIHEFLEKLPVEKIWGIGVNTAAYLHKMRIYTALEFAQTKEEWIKEHLSKPYYEIWKELRGEFIYQLNTEEKHDYKSVSKTRTFTPASNNKDFVYSQLSKNVENACIKLRRHNLVAKEVVFYLKTQDFKHAGLELKLSIPVATPREILEVIEQYFYNIYVPGTLYRATGVVLMKLETQQCIQMDLFGASVKVEAMSTMYDVVDKVALKYGKHTLFLGSSLLAMKNHQHGGDRGNITDRKRFLLKGETNRKKLGIPLLGWAK
jgi:nucleotidyltransferase/DNA polymerase involved in DNA repair